MWQKEIGSKILSILKLNNQILNYKHSWLIKLYIFLFNCCHKLEFVDRMYYRA